MTTTKRHTPTLTAIVTAVMLALGSVQCGNRTGNGLIAQADSLSETSPAAALRLIDSIDAAGGMSRSTEMRLTLLKMKARNKLCLPLDSDTLVMLDNYFTDHGTPNERMLANYILGCYYIDNGNSSETMRCFRMAAEAADTTRGDCDYSTLHKVHVHTAQQLMYQNALMDAMDENTLALKYALMAKDTFNAIITMEQRSNIYLYQRQENKAFNIRSKLYGLYMKHGYSKEAAISLSPLVKMLVERNNLAEAKRCLDKYEKESGLIDGNGNIEQGREAYYVNKGIYMAKINKLDSAEYYFRKCANIVNLSDVLRDCYVGLSDIYKRQQNPDSVAKYSELAHITTDSMYAEMNTTHLQQMRAMYDYNEYKLSAEVYKRKAVSARLTVIIIVLLVAIVAISVVMYIRRKRRARKMEIMRYERSIPVGGINLVRT